MEQMAKKLSTFYVESGNWRAHVTLNIDPNKVENYDYMEAATIAFETIFSKNGEFDEKCELISLINEVGDDYFDPNYSGDLMSVPEALFGVLTSCYLEKNIEKENKKWYFLSSKIFENAGQPYNIEGALKLEKKWSKQVEDFKQKEKQVKKEENKSKNKRRKKDK